MDPWHPAACGEEVVPTNLSGFVKADRLTTPHPRDDGELGALTRSTRVDRSDAHQRDCERAHSLSVHAQRLDECPTTDVHDAMPCLTGRVNECSHGRGGHGQNNFTLALSV